VIFRSGQASQDLLEHLVAYLGTAMLFALGYPQKSAPSDPPPWVVRWNVNGVMAFPPGRAVLLAGVAELSA
jgi:hypothetical protein